MTKLVTVIVGGSKLEFEAKEAEFYIEPPELEDGSPNPKTGDILGYKVETEGLGIPVLWFRLSSIDAIMVKEIADSG